MVDMVITAMATVIMVMGMDMVIITMEDTITMAIMAMVATTADMDTMAVMDTEAIIENWENCSHFSLEYIYLLSTKLFFLIKSFGFNCCIIFECFGVLL